VKRAAALLGFLALLLTGFSCESNDPRVKGLDPHFGDRGLAVHQLTNGSDEVLAAALLPDGRVLTAAAGNSDYSPDEQADLLLARYTIDGQLDDAFGSGGKVLLNIAHGPESEDTPGGLAIQPDGRLVVASEALDTSGQHATALVVYRFEANGAVDYHFGRDGAVLVEDRAFRSFGAPVAGVALTDDGRIVVAAASLLVRLRPDGSPDPTFGERGVVRTPMRLFDLALGPTGAVFGAGKLGAHSVVARYRSDGVLEHRFVTRLRADLDTPALALQGDGKIVVAGQGSGEQLTVERYDSRGRPDSGFGERGRRETSTPLESATVDIAVGPNGGIAVAGTAAQPRDEIIALARLSPDGRAADVALVDLDEDDERMFERAMVVLVRSDGRVLVGGGVGGERPGLDNTTLFDQALVQFEPN
jgi:uncharacterized delta-60 repeat protein